MKDIIKCVIIDDETKAIENIKLLIDVYCPKFEVIGEVSDPTTIQSDLRKYQPDVVFLDIQIGPRSIFDILNTKDVEGIAIVFVTAHLDYAFEGYSFRASDYLLKPIDPDKLVTLYHHLLNRLSTTKPSDNHLTQELNLILQEKNKPTKIRLVDADGIHLFRINEIMYCVGEGAYTNFSFTNKRNKYISKNLKVFEEKLKSYNFFRINKSTLINLEFVKNYLKEDGGYIEMEDGNQVVVSRRQKKEFLKALESFTIQ